MERELDYDVDLQTDLSNAFEGIDTTATFAAWQALPRTPPAGLHVEGVGDVDMPLSEKRIRQLIEKAQRVPCGRKIKPLPARRGRKTPPNVPVSGIWEIKGDQLDFLDPAWQEYLVNLSKRVATRLGVDAPIGAKLYNMRIFEKGATSKPDTDPELIRGMFGTLIVCLPSAHTGGEVLVKHSGECITLRSSDAKQSFACWYSDVTHEVMPVKSGYRCVLTYNLTSEPGRTRPTASAFDLEKHRLKKTLQLWIRDAADSDATDVPSHLYHPLAAKCAKEKLKDGDLKQFQVLQNFAHELPFEIFISSLEKSEYGSVHRETRQKLSVYDDTDSDSNASHHEIEDPEETSCVVKSLRSLDGTVIARNYDLDVDFCLNYPFDEEDDHEDYNNDGEGHASATHWFYRAALVIVPHCKIGDYLAHCTFGSSDSGEPTSSDDNATPGSTARKNCDTALRYLGRIPLVPSAQTAMLDAMRRLYITKSSKTLPMTDILKTALRYSYYPLFQTVAVRHRGRLPIAFFDWARNWLNRGPDEERYEKYQTWISLLSLGYTFTPDQTDIIKKIDAALPRFSTLAQDAIRQYIMSFPENNRVPTISDAEFLLCAVLNHNSIWADKCAFLTSIFERFPQVDATAFLLAVLFRLKDEVEAERLPASDITELYRSLSFRVSNRDRKLYNINAASRPEWGPQARVTLEALVQFTCDLHNISIESANVLKAFLQQVQAQCATFSAEDMDDLWMPFLYKLIAAEFRLNSLNNLSTYQQLTLRFIKHLDDEIIGLCPPAVSSKISRSSCTCIDCESLNLFIQDASEEEIRFRIDVAGRQHLQYHIDCDRLPCTFETERIGNPYTLVVMKRHISEVKKWHKHQNEIYRTITRKIKPDHLEWLIGAEESTRVRELAKARPASPVPYRRR
ncbi:hypothetical protein MJO28_013358 [Puccinia striiformis f. sp. tritici]|uniref:Uncharacterized protein n=1 Tax=Puccinia striiformis f. sp. tritici TaxID=168172 RepID=A0ACC0DY06_9BASI|nr:hypothetical protein MJO28_013358 [Puccinia striiformis f. sp. tritici]